MPRWAGALQRDAAEIEEHLGETDRIHGIVRRLRSSNTSAAHGAVRALTRVRSSSDRHPRAVPTRSARSRAFSSSVTEGARP